MRYKNSNEIYLISKLWWDPLENRNYDGYDPWGFTTDKNLVESLLQETVDPSVSPYPLKYLNKGNPVPKYKVETIYEITNQEELDN